MKCFFCKGNMTESTATHMIELKSCIVIVKNVPCHKCTQCGEVSFSGTVVEKLEEIAELFERSAAEVAVVNYSDKTA